MYEFLWFTRCNVQLRLGQYSSGSLIRKPINTADLDGSTNILLDCASIYGTDAIRWSFTPLRSVTGEIFWISMGYELFTAHMYQQEYELKATVNSSVLIVRRLSSLTEGRYSCYDCVEAASALLIVIRMY